MPWYGGKASPHVASANPARRRLTIEERDAIYARIKELNDAGWSRRQIARETGLADRSITRICIRFGWESSYEGPGHNNGSQPYANDLPECFWCGAGPGEKCVSTRTGKTCKPHRLWRLEIPTGRLI